MSGMIAMPYETAEDISGLLHEAARQNAIHHPELARRGVYRLNIPWRKERRNRVKLLPEMVADGHADCDDLVPARVAELWLRGERDAYPWAIRTPQGWHAIVVRGDGRFEDPSRALHPRSLPVVGQVQRWVDGDGRQRWGLPYEDDQGAKMIHVPDPSDDVGDDIAGLWDYMPRLVAASVPLGATVLRTVYPGAATIAEIAARAIVEKPDEIEKRDHRSPLRQLARQQSRVDPTRDMKKYRQLRAMRALL